MQYRMLLSEDGDYMSVIGMCVSYKKLRLIEELIQAEVDFNAPPTPWHVNLWQMIVASKEKSISVEKETIKGEKSSKYLPRIAERTVNLLSPFDDRTDIKAGFDQEIDRIISTELSKREVDLH